MNDRVSVKKEKKLTQKTPQLIVQFVAQETGESDKIKIFEL